MNSQRPQNRLLPTDQRRRFEDESERADSRSAGTAAVPGPIGRLLRFTAGSIRTQPRLSVAIVAVSLLSGVIWWCAEPLYWEVEAAVVVAPPTDTNRLANQNLDIRTRDKGFRYLTPNDIGAILTTSAVLDTAREQLTDRHAAERIAQADQATRPESGSVYARSLASSPAGIWTWRQQARHMALQAFDDVQNWLNLPFSRADGGAHSSAGSANNAPAWLRAEIDGERYESDRVLIIRVQAPHPGIAEDAPQFLIDIARNRLSEFESGDVLDRLVESETALEEAREHLDEIRANMAEFMANLSVADPAQRVAVLDGRLETIRDQQAQLDIDIMETEAERRGLITQIERMERQGETRMTRQVTGDNPRIAEIRRDIANLEGQYAALVDYTEAHPEKIGLRQRIDELRKELENTPPTIVVEERVEPNPAYEQLIARRQETDRKLALLAGREVALQDSEREVLPELKKMQEQSSASREWNRRLARAEQAYNLANEELMGLYESIAASQQFDHIRLLEPPRVRSRSNPDRPRTALIAMCTFGAALTLLALLPALRATARRRVVSMHQIEMLGRELPIRVVAEVPARPVRGLLR